MALLSVVLRSALSYHDGDGDGDGDADAQTSSEPKSSILPRSQANSRGEAEQQLD